MKDELERKTRPSTTSIFRALGDVMRQAMVPKPVENHDFKFEERRVLHDASPPHVQGVNQHLDKKGVPLSSEALELLEKQIGMEAYKHQGFSENGKFRTKDMKAELNIAKAFGDDSQRLLEQVKAGKIDITPDQMREIRAYNEAGKMAHTLFGAAKAATNPYLAHEDDFGVGATFDYIVSNKPK